MNNNVSGLIAVFNACGWAFKLSNERYSSRLIRICDYIRGEELPIIIALQEILVGRDLKYIDLLKRELPEYELIMPVGYDKANYKSIVNIVLVRKDICKSYECNILDVSKTLYMYNYVNIETVSGEKVRLLNLHMPCTTFLQNKAAWYAKSRVMLSSEMWNAVCKEAELHKGEKNFIVLGDFNEGTSGSNITKLEQDYNMKNITESKATYFNKELGEESQIDFIFVSEKTENIGVAKKNVMATVDRGVYEKGLSDHALIKMKFAV